MYVHLHMHVYKYTYTHSMQALGTIHTQWIYTNTSEMPTPPTEVSALRVPDGLFTPICQSPGPAILTRWLGCSTRYTGLRFAHREGFIRF